MIEIILVGNPQAWSAPKVTRNGHTFSPKYQKKLDHQCLVRKKWFVPPITGPVFIEILFYMPIPKSTSKKNKILMISGEIRPTKKPDIDNMCKYAIDVIKGIVILDDNQVIELRARKIYSEVPEVVIQIEEI
jgi:Holliday junction resolvase RusA-like endonuclease